MRTKSILGFRFWKGMESEVGIFMEFAKEGGGKKYEEIFLLPFIAVDIFVFYV